MAELRAVEELSHRAIFTTTPMPSLYALQRTAARRQFQGESVSWNSDEGRNVSWRPKEGIGEGRLWLLQSMYAFNGEARANLGVFLLLDSEGTDHGRFGPDGVTPVEVPAGRELSWTGQLWVPEGWRVGVRFEDMLGGAYCHWRYTAIEM